MNEKEIKEADEFSDKLADVGLPYKTVCVVTVFAMGISAIVGYFNLWIGVCVLSASLLVYLEKICSTYFLFESIKIRQKEKRR